MMLDLIRSLLSRLLLKKMKEVLFVNKKYLLLLFLLIIPLLTSCGKKEIYDGSFSHKVISGMGVTAEYLTSKGIEVYSEDEIESLLD